MHSDELPITGPCPIDLDAIGFDRGSAVSHCTHCAKNVTILSNMTRGEARDFMRANKGKKMCISYARDERGRIRFRPERTAPVVPASRLTRRVVESPTTRSHARARRAAGLAMALSIGAAMGACTPHAEAPATHDVVVDVERPEPPKPPEPVVVEPVPDPVPLAGAAVIPEPMIEGEIEVPDPDQIGLDEPCDGKKGSGNDAPEPVQTARRTADAKRPGMQVL